MKTSRRRFAPLLALATLIAATGLAGAAATPAPHVPASKLKLHVIVHVIARPLCSGLREAIGPAIALMLKNNAIIKKSQPLFDDYVRYNIEGQSGASSRQLAQVKMEYLVGPLVKNSAQIEKLLNDPKIFRNNQSFDDKALAKMKAGMLNALQAQNAALDLINGFVTTRQLASMQHQGFEYISAITTTGVKNTQATPSPNPDFYNNNYAGLAPLNLGGSTVNLKNLPGLSLGYNPIRAVAHAMRLTRMAMTMRQNKVADNVVAAARICSGAAAPSTASPR